MLWTVLLCILVILLAILIVLGVIVLVKKPEDFWLVPLL